MWVGARIYIADEPPALDALADELGVLQPPVTAKPARAKRAVPSSSAAVAA